MARKKSLLIALYYYDPYVSGVTVYTKRLAEGLVERGHKVTILTSHFDKTVPKKEIINGVTVIRRPVLFTLGKGVIMPTFVFDIARYARSHDYVNLALPMAEAGPASLLVPKDKLIMTYHCDIYLGPELVNRAIAFVSLVSMRVALTRTKTIVVNTLDYLSHSKMKRYLSKATAIYPIVDADTFQPPSDKGTFFTESLHIGASTKKIGFVGRVVYEKGIDYLFDSIKYLEKELSDFRIIIVGDYTNVAGGSIKDELDAYIEKYPNKITFTGYLSDEDRNRFLSGIDVLVLPSIDPLESFGMVQVEAMLCGAPVVTSDLPGVREVVQKTGFGRISKLKDSKDIAKNILEVLHHPEIYKPSHQKVSKIFNKDIPLDLYLSTMS